MRNQSSEIKCHAHNQKASYCPPSFGLQMLCTFFCEMLRIFNGAEPKIKIISPAVITDFKSTISGSLFDEQLDSNF